MTDFFGPVQTRVFYGFVAVGGDPKTAVVALRGTASNTEWWDDLHWDLVPFAQVSGGGRVAQGFYDIYSTLGTMTSGQQQSTPAPGAFAAEVAHADRRRFRRRSRPWPADGGVRPQPGWRARDAPGRRRHREHAARSRRAWTFTSPRVGDAIFAARYGALSTVSWRIYNQVNVVPYFPVDTSGGYQPAHRRVRDQLPGEGALEPGLRPRAEHLSARALARHGAAGPGLRPAS